MRGIVTPEVQYPAQPLKTDISRTAVPIPQSLALELSAHVADTRADTLLVNEWGNQLTPWTWNGPSGRPGPRSRTCRPTSATTT